MDADSDLLPVASGRDDDISESSSAAVGEVIKHVRPRVEDTSFSEMATTADPSYAVARESDADYAKLLPEVRHSAFPIKPPAHIHTIQIDSLEK